jgi:hypothetical protein
MPFRTTIPLLLAACGPGLGSAEFARSATAEITNAALADDLRLLLDAGKAELSLCGNPFRARVRHGEPGYVGVVLRVTGMPGQTLQVSPEAVSEFGPAYNLCAIAVLRDTKVSASGSYDARVVLHWNISAENGPP